MSYATLAELKARVEKTDTDDDTWLQDLLDAATRNIDRATNRPDGFEADAAASARLYTGSGDAVLRIDECVEITLVAVKSGVTATSYTSWAATDWIAFRGDPRDPDFNSLPYTGLMVDLNGDYSIFTSGFVGAGYDRFYPYRQYRQRGYRGRGQPTVQVTARWGFSVSVPDDIREACAAQAARWYKRFQSAMSDALATADLGRILYTQSLDPDIKRLLADGRYLRPTVGRR